MKKPGKKIALLTHFSLKTLYRSSLIGYIDMAKIVFEEDAEIVVPESTKKQQDDDIFDQSSSDDEAPEAISTSKAKENLITKAQSEKEASEK